MMWSRAVNLVFLTALLIMRRKAEADKLSSSQDVRNVARDYFEKSLLNFMYQRRLFMDGFANGTATFQRDFDFELPKSLQAIGEGRGRRRKMKQMNRTLIAIIMAYTLKFMFLIPTFMGTFILLKFTTALAGFFYALFAAVLGLDHHREH